MDGVKKNEECFYIKSSSSHANDTDKVANLCNLARGQDAFTGGEILLKCDRRVSTVGELGPGTRAVQLEPYNGISAKEVGAGRT